MRIVTLFILFIFSAQFVTAQNKISGKVVDGQNRLPLPDATVTIINPVDSAAIGFAVADKNGLFEIKNLVKGNFVLGITFTGYAPYTKHLNITQSQFVMDLDTIFMQLDTSLLMGAVVVTAPPIQIKKDTIEFKASAFKTKPNASVEDLLKKLPGVEVDKDGNITSQGEEITKVYVDGKEFFLNDPKLATKNLSSDMVEAVQVFDDMSEQAKFTKIDDGSRKRTINIKLKKDKKKGIFGRTSASAGTEGRYEGSGSFNTFNNTRQISILGSANNINRLGFTDNDLVSSMGGMSGARRGGGGSRGGGGGAPAAANGNTKSWSTGINFRDEWGSKLNFSGSYFVAKTNNGNYSESYRQNMFGGDSSSFVNSTSNSSNVNINHRLNFRLEYMIDSMNSVLVTPALNYQKGTSGNDATSTTRATNARLDYKAIDGSTHSSNTRDGENFTNDLLFRHRFHKPGRTFTMGWNTALNNSNGNGFNFSPYHFFDSTKTEYRFDNRQQINDQTTRSFNNTISSSVTEMIDSSMVWELNYAYTINKSNSDRNVFNYDTANAQFDLVDTAQTNYFENLFTANRLGTNFRVKKQKYDYQFGGAVNFATMQNFTSRVTAAGKDSSFTMRQSYTNFFPNASFNFNPAPRKNLRFNYRGSTRAPSVSQLQNVRDESNRLNIRTGNPNLKQEFTHNFNVTYSTFNLTNFLYLNMNAGASVINNKIVNTTSKEAEGVLLTRPDNLNGSQSFNFSGTVGIPLKKVTTGRRSPVNLNLTSSARYGRDVSKIMDTVRFNYTSTLGQRVSFNYFIQDKLDLQANANFNINNANYTAQGATDYRYFDQHYSIDVTYTIMKRIMINNDFDYYINTGRAAGFNQAIPRWNAYVSCLLFKKQNGEIRISGIDLLNQNKSINRTVNELYVEDTYTRVLQRFFLVSFMYNFKNFGKDMFPGRGNRQRTGRNY